MKARTNKSLVVLKSTLSRLPLYYSILCKLRHDGEANVSASVIAKKLNLNHVLVRKDLSSVSSEAGTPRVGFKVERLYEDISNFLGYRNVEEAVLVGVGSLGHTLLSYSGFQNFGLSIVAGFDNDENLNGIKVNGKPILPMEKMANLVRRMKIRIAIIAVPQDQAQMVCDQLVRAGIQAIWNFAPVSLDVTPDILVKNENLAASLALLSHKLSQKMKKTEQQQNWTL